MNLHSYLKEVGQGDMHHQDVGLILQAAAAHAILSRCNTHSDEDAYERQYWSSVAAKVEAKMTAPVKQVHDEYVDFRGFRRIAQN